MHWGSFTVLHFRGTRLGGAALCIGGISRYYIFRGGTTRVLLALKYFISISREEQPYALGVFHDITF